MPSWSRYSVTSENIGIYDQIFEKVEVIDCHTHIGIDRDGHRLAAHQIIKQMDRESVNMAIVFPLDDPRDQKMFHEPNDEIYSAANTYPGRFIPFFRLNPNFDWKDEFKLRLSQGFKGVKLHPRSQNFKLASADAMRIYDACQKHNLVVVVHAGFGLEKIADDLAKIIKRFAKLRLIIGHSAFPDLDNTIKKVAKSENVLFDTSTCKIFDLIDLMKNVDLNKIAYGSDMPYYAHDVALEGLIDTAITMGLTAGQIRKMLGSNVAKWFR
ncbi:amidohydrolase family protein [Candidatus Woesearchaeota archaeon]|nr:amidohydrolase family protein [Candidatus Woesearchaeota archaeon]